MLQSYLFDIGNVIITFDYGRAMEGIRNLCAMPPEEAHQVVAEMSPELERGSIGVDEFIAKASRAIGFTGDATEFRRAFEDIFELNLPMAQFIEELSASGATLYLLSNTNGIHVPFFESTYPVFSHFHGRIYSHEVGCMKPEPEIYQTTIQRLNLIPEKTLYIDDLPANCEAGRNAGFPTIQYDATRHSDFLSEAQRIIRSAP